MTWPPPSDAAFSLSHKAGVEAKKMSLFPIGGIFSGTYMSDS
jgi:hypothetical protein